MKTASKPLPRLTNEMTIGQLCQAGFDVRVQHAMDSAALPAASTDRPEYTVHFLRAENTLLIGIAGKAGTARQIPLPAGLIAVEPEAEATDTTAAEAKAACRRAGKDPNDPDPNVKDRALSRGRSTSRHVATALRTHLRPG